MPIPIVMPRLGMTMTEGKVVEWPLDRGTPVEQGEVVLIIESDKSEIEIEASAGGTFAATYVEADEDVPCGTLLGVLVAEDDVSFDAEEFRATWQRENPVLEGDSTDQQAAETKAADAAPTRDASTSPRSASVTPAARRLARELGVDTGDLVGTGPKGRITREDVEAAAGHSPDLRNASGGVRLEVRSEGEGPTVVLLPGFGTDISALAAQVAPLTDSFQVLGVNPRGVGKSDAPDLPAYEITQAAEDLAALLDTPAHLVGTSLGTAVAIELALRCPEKVASLSLLAPFVEVTPRLEAVTQSWCSLAEEGAAGRLAEALLPWFFGDATLRDEKQRARILHRLPSTLSAAPARTLCRTRAGMLAWSGSRTADLGQIQAPTLVVFGEDDLLAPDGRQIANAIPGASTLPLPGVGHAVGIEAPEETNAAIAEHLATASGRR
ncbi:MAG: alpha/beta fold hydrolase [bacterium]